MIKYDKTMIKHMKKTSGKLQFFIFLIFFAPLEAKMMKHEKNDKTMFKKWLKNDKTMIKK